MDSLDVAEELGLLRVGPFFLRTTTLLLLPAPAAELLLVLLLVLLVETVLALFLLLPWLSMVGSSVLEASSKLLLKGEGVGHFTAKRNFGMRTPSTWEETTYNKAEKGLGRMIAIYSWSESTTYLGKLVHFLLVLFLLFFFFLCVFFVRRRINTTI